MTFYEMADYPSAVSSFASVLSAAPNNRDAIEWRTRAYNEIATDEATGGRAVTAETRTALIASAQQWLKLDPNADYPHLLLANQLNAAGDAAGAQAMVAQFTNLPFITRNLEMRAGRGSVTMFADIINKKLTPGQPLRLRVTFFGPGGTSLGTKDGSVTAPPVDATAAFQVDFETTQTVQGYSYAVLP
jgi:hypothetical protein